MKSFTSFMTIADCIAMRLSILGRLLPVVNDRSRPYIGTRITEPLYIGGRVHVVNADPQAEHFRPLNWVELTGRPCARDELVDKTQRNESNVSVGTPA